MRILIDIAHPAHVHLIKNTYFELVKRNHKIWVTVKEIPEAIELLKIYDIPYTNLGFKSDSIIGKAVSQVFYNFFVLLFVIFKKIEIGFGSSLTLAQVSKISKMKSIILDDDDDEVEPLFVKYAHTFANVILSPECVKRNSKKCIKYNGYHELAYLHPNRFIPDQTIIKELGLKPNEEFFIVRFNAFKAHHDLGVNGLSLENKRKLINLLLERGRVYITSERNIEKEFEKFQLNVSPEKIHSLIYFANMFVGDSQTMTSEAALLGTPAVKLNSFAGKLSVPNELENKYNLCFSYLPSQVNEFFDKIEEILNTKEIKSIWKENLKILHKEKIDVTTFFISQLETK